MDNRNEYKRGDSAHIADRGFGRIGVIVSGARFINGERWLLARFADRKGRMCVHPSSLEAA